METPPTMAAPVAAKKKRGCLFYGCLVVVIVAALLATGLGVGLWYLNRQYTGFVNQYTDTAPMTLPEAEVTPADYSVLEKRVETFGVALKDGKATETLELSAAEINALLQRNSSFKVGQGRMNVMLEGDQVRGQVSIPLDPLAEMWLFRRLRGRYLNGSGALRVGMVNGRLDVRLISVGVNGKPVPAEITQALSQHNLAESAYQDPDKAAVLSKLGRVEVKDGRLIVAPK